MSLTTVNQGLEASSAAEAAAPAPAPASSDHGWVWQVTALSVALGAMLALAISTTFRIRHSGLPGSRFGVSAAILNTYREQNVRQQQVIKDLQEQVRTYEGSISDNTRAVRILKKEFEEFKLLAGLSPVEGPGVRVTLSDSPETRLPDLSPEEEKGYLIHDQDLYSLLNELKAAGAEALAISGADRRNLQRIVATTAIRCVGPSAVVNGTPLSAPYTILAIGNAADMRAALEMPQGYVETRGLDVLKMIRIEEATSLVLPAFTGSFSPKHARPAPQNP